VIVCGLWCAIAHLPITLESASEMSAVVLGGALQLCSLTLLCGLGGNLMVES